MPYYYYKILAADPQHYKSKTDLSGPPGCMALRPAGKDVVGFTVPRVVPTLYNILHPNFPTLCPNTIYYHLPSRPSQKPQGCSGALGCSGNGLWDGYWHVRTWRFACRSFLLLFTVPPLKKVKVKKDSIFSGTLIHAEPGCSLRILNSVPLVATVFIGLTPEMSSSSDVMVHIYRYLCRHLHTNVNNNRWVAPCLVSTCLDRGRRPDQEDKER